MMYLICTFDVVGVVNELDAMEQTKEVIID